MTARAFTPTGIDFDNFNGVVAAARKHLSGEINTATADGGAVAAGVAHETATSELILDLGRLQRSNTAVICFIITLLRDAAGCGVAARVVNIPLALRQLMNLYGFSPEAARGELNELGNHREA